MCISRDSPLSSRKMKLWRFTFETRNVEMISCWSMVCQSGWSPGATGAMRERDSSIGRLWGAISRHSGPICVVWKASEQEINFCRETVAWLQDIQKRLSTSSHMTNSVMSSQKEGVDVENLCVFETHVGEFSEIWCIFHLSSLWFTKKVEPQQIFDAERSVLEGMKAWIRVKCGKKNSLLDTLFVSQTCKNIKMFWSFVAFLWCLISIPTPLFSWQEHKRLLKLQEVGRVTKCDECILSNDNDGAREKPTPKTKEGVYRVSPESVRDVHIVLFCT